MAAEKESRKDIYDPDKSYSYTWPGQPAKIVKGDALNQLVKGADVSALEISEVGPRHDVIIPQAEALNPVKK